jgi:hypothetical protein
MSWLDVPAEKVKGEAVAFHGLSPLAMGVTQEPGMVALPKSIVTELLGHLNPL